MASQRTIGSSANLSKKKNIGIPLSWGMMLVTLGVVYGDIGTSPMYVMKSIVGGNGGLTSVTEEMILGSLSLVIWTITLITTVKYVLVAMKADNHGEGGIFALYSLVRKAAKWLIIPAMIGGAALLADGILTPAVTVTTAIEGLRSTDWGYALLGNDQTGIVIITIVIICALFLMQRAGTSSIGRLFGPIMTLWFLFLGGAGVMNFIATPGILRAINPIYGIMFLFSPNNHAGMRILGFVFLCTTGAEALYSDMGHVGKPNIFATWPLVKACLILNYLGQGAWLLQNCKDPALISMTDMNPFFQMLPAGARPFAVVLSTVAAIIASQALITGSYTLVSEATRLDLLPHLQVSYPSETKGQLYIPLVNNIMWVGTSVIVLLFQTSEHMEAAYGLAITVTMLMTTMLLYVYLSHNRKKHLLALVFVAFFGVIEFMFFSSSLTKFFHGGYFTVLMAAAAFLVMYIWRRGTAVEHTQSVYLPVNQFKAQLGELRDDADYPLMADNLVFLTNDSSFDKLDRDILYSILNKRPKRAKAYWFLNVQVSDEPFTLEYSVNNFGTDYLFKVQLRLGYKVNQRVNAFLRQVVADLVASGQLPPQEHKYSIYRNSDPVGDFRFCVIRKLLGPDAQISGFDYRIMMAKYSIRAFCGSPARWYGLENSNIIFEYVPLFTRAKKVPHLEYVQTASSTGANITTSRSLDEEEEDIFSATMSEQVEENLHGLNEVIGGDTATFRPQITDDEDESEDM